jgi:hypothetical protein
MPTLRNLALLAAALAALFSALVVLAAAVPNERIVAHLKEAGPALERDYYPSPLTAGKVDVYTDCVAAGNNIDSGSGSGSAADPAEGLWRRAMRSPVVGRCTALTAWLAGTQAGGVDYFRYWNGYTVLTRPLLWAAGYGPLRALTAGLLAVLLAALLALVARRLGWRVAACLAAALLFAGVDAAAVTVVHSFSWSIAALAGVWVLRAAPERVWRLEPWFVIGAVTVFLELLNNALVTLTLPLALALLLAQREEGAPPWAVLRGTVRAAAGWALGYGGLWAVKFALAWGTLGAAALELLSG